MRSEITVIIRTVGRPSLARALQSVALQGLPCDVVVVDVAGAGSILPGMDRHAALNLRVLDPQQGSSPSGLMTRPRAAQAGLDAVHTPWALFLDDDDELLGGHLQKLLTAVCEQPEAVAACTGVEQVRLAATGAGNEASVPPPVERLQVWDRPFEPWHLLVANHLPIHSVLFNAERVRQAGVRFDETFETFEDWDFWLQVQALGPMVWVPGISARYWVQSQPPEAAASAQSAAQIARHGDERYYALWRKWWPRAPQAWWTCVLQAARDEPLISRELGLLQQAVREAGTLREDLIAREQQLHGLQRQLDDLAAERRALHALAQAQGRELAAAEAHQERMSHQLATQSGQLQQLGQERDQARIDEQGARLHLQAVLHSTSWRITAPWRAAGAPVRWLAHRMARMTDPQWWKDTLWRLRHRSYPRPAVWAGVLPDPYQQWLSRHDGNTDAERARALSSINSRSDLPLISVLMPVFNPPLNFLDEAIRSLQAQWYPKWELCMADDASTAPGVAEHLRAWTVKEPRIRLVQRPTNGHIAQASNSALQAAAGPWVALFDQDDLLPPQALWRVVQALDAHPDAGLLYSDEDKINEAGQRFGPYFKPAFDIDLLRGQNMISHLGVYRAELVRAVGGFREGYEGSQDHDLALRCVEQLAPHQVVHIPRVLYHWRVHAASTASGNEAKPYAMDAGLRAVRDHVMRLGLRATVQPHPAIPHHVVKHELPPGGMPVRLLCWGPHAEPALAAHRSRLAQDGLDVAPSNAVAVGTWRQARAQIVAWAEEVQGLKHGWDAVQGRPVVAVVLRAGDRGGTPTEGALWRSCMARLQEQGVGAVSPALRDSHGRLFDAGWLLGPDGHVRPIARGAGLGNHGYYGQLSLAHGVSVLPAVAAAVQLQAVSVPGGDHEPAQTQESVPAANESSSIQGLALRAGWRAVWAADLVWEGVSMEPDKPLQGVPAESVAAFFVHEAVGEQAHDLAYSPHLCALHADHRIRAPGSRFNHDRLPTQAQETTELVGRVRSDLAQD